MAADTPVVELHGVSFEYVRGGAGLTGIDLIVHGAETVVLLGPNGSGKTTLLRLLAGDLVCASGDVLVRASGPRRGAERPSIGYAPDRSTQFDELTGRENAHWFTLANGGEPADADALLAGFRLTEAIDLPAGEYSFGMRRKVMLVQALAHRPALLLLDEPTVGLDPEGLATLSSVLRESTAAGAATVIATNDTRVARTADRVVFLDRGRIVADDPPAVLLEAVRGRTRIELRLDGPLGGDPELPAGAHATVTDAGLVIDSGNGTADLPAICNAITRAGGAIRRVDVLEPGFDDVFRKLTGRALRADPPMHETGTATPQSTGNAGVRRGPPWRRR